MFQLFCMFQQFLGDHYLHPSSTSTSNTATVSRQLSQLHLEHHLIQACLQGVHLAVLSNTEEAISLVSSQTEAICRHSNRQPQHITHLSLRSQRLHASHISVSYLD